MRKFKIISSAVATLVVLIFCISVGVYAASSVSFKITSTVSFQSPNISGITIECYVVHDGYDDVLQHTYSVDESGSITGDGESWNFSTIRTTANGEKNTYLAYTKRGTKEPYIDHYIPITLKFVIKHSTPLNLYAYFTKAETDGATGTYIKSDTIKGDTQKDLDLIKVTMSDCITEETGIAGQVDGDTEYKGSIVTMELDLIQEATLVKDTVTIPNYTLVVSKFMPEVGTTEE